MKLKMLSDYVLVKLKEADKKTSGGIILTAGTVEQPQIGTVVSAGPGKHDSLGNFIEVQVTEGDVILCGKNSLMNSITHEGEKYYIMRYEEIYAVQTEE